jgi:hypothetical protein
MIWFRKTIVSSAATAAMGLLLLGGCKKNSLPAVESRSLHEQHLARLRGFSAEKEKQSQVLAVAVGEKISQSFNAFLLPQKVVIGSRSPTCTRTSSGARASGCRKILT